MNKFDEMREAVNEAKTTIAAADNVAQQMGSLVAPRLRHCFPRDLKRMKRELQDFNIHTGKWKGRQ